MHTESLNAPGGGILEVLLPGIARACVGNGTAPHPLERRPCHGR